ncbi:ribose ABC transporter substrate-binding protein [Paenibacillus selenitireducens]|jgi:ribose transport system substrate-binding protein|uniref:Ribose ABC transporter substrate-binding protein n=1 Tax=Paenibacillus selenitireducens TaxID=1324314 RepID=A0A1T2XM26_9BACL|nr:substrate-binding domain-containing protein [Paenibacillus selenitireducens]OPA80917.1 ribose ABC transporter substrate-binding protein [Paenibacillus selenitireducens]
MKKALSVLLSIVFIVSLAACSGGSSSKDGAKNISILTPFLSSVTTNEMVEALKKQAEDHGWKANVIDTKGDVGQLASRMEDVIASKTDAIVIVSTDPNQLKAQIQSAKDKGIPVLGCDSGYIDGMTMNATSDNTEMSKMVTTHLFDSLGKKGNLVVLTYRAHPGVLKRTLLLDEMLQQNPDVKKVTEMQVEVPGPIESARKEMESLLLANKAEGSITAVWTGWDEPAIGAAQAIEASGRKDIVVIGIDGNSQAVDMIKKGSPLVATVKQNFPGMAEIVAQQLENVFQGKEVEGTELYAPASLITKDNA